MLIEEFQPRFQVEEQSLRRLQVNQWDLKENRGKRESIKAFLPQTQTSINHIWALIHYRFVLCWLVFILTF